MGKEKPEWVPEVGGRARYVRDVEIVALHGPAQSGVTIKALGLYRLVDISQLLPAPDPAAPTVEEDWVIAFTDILVEELGVKSFSQRAELRGVLLNRVRQLQAEREGE